MNQRIEHCLYQAGLTASGCWDELGAYEQEAIEKFAELIVRECADVGSKFSMAHPEDIRYQIKRHFGVEE